MPQKKIFRRILRQVLYLRGKNTAVGKWEARLTGKKTDLFPLGIRE